MSILPVQAHLTAARMEDALTTWNERDPAHSHPNVTEAGHQVVQLCGEMIQVFTDLLEKTNRELTEFTVGIEHPRPWAQ